MGNAFRQRPAGQSGRVIKVKTRKKQSLYIAPKPAPTIDEMEAEFARLQTQLDGLVDETEFR